MVKTVSFLKFLVDFFNNQCFIFMLWYDNYIFSVVLCVVMSRLQNWLLITVVLNVILLIRCGFVLYVDMLAVAVT